VRKRLMQTHQFIFFVVDGPCVVILKNLFLDMVQELKRLDLDSSQDEIARLNTDEAVYLKDSIIVGDTRYPVYEGSQGKSWDDMATEVTHEQYTKCLLTFSDWSDYEWEHWECK